MVKRAVGLYFYDKKAVRFSYKQSKGFVDIYTSSGIPTRHDVKQLTSILTDRVDCISDMNSTRGKPSVRFVKKTTENILPKFIVFSNVDEDYDEIPEYTGSINKQIGFGLPFILSSKDKEVICTVEYYDGGYQINSLKELSNMDILNIFMYFDMLKRPKKVNDINNAEFMNFYPRSYVSHIYNKYKNELNDIKYKINPVNISMI